MRKRMVLLLMLTSLAMLSGCVSKAFDLNGTTKIELEAVNGSAVSITDAADIQRIIENLSELGLEKLEYSEPSVLAYRLACYDANGEELERFAVPKGEQWLGFDGYDHAIVKGSLDIAFWEEQLANSSAAPKKTTTVEYVCQFANMKLELPEGWEWSVREYNANDAAFGISFWPEGQTSGKIDLNYYPSGFGVCGTGLVQEIITFDHGLSGSMGTFDDHEVWDFIRFQNVPGDYVAMTDRVGDWWETYGDEAMFILSTARVGENVLIEEEAIEIARGECTVEYDYVRGYFDFETGEWRVNFYPDHPGGDQSVYVNAEGEIVSIEYGE